jgi:hypothetical protein
MVDDEIGEASAAGRAAQALIEELAARDIGVVEAASAEDGNAVISSDSAIHAVLLDWDLDGDKDHAGESIWDADPVAYQDPGRTASGTRPHPFHRWDGDGG